MNNGATKGGSPIRSDLHAQRPGKALAAARLQERAGPHSSEELIANVDEGTTGYPIR